MSTEVITAIVTIVTTLGAAISGVAGKLIFGRIDDLKADVKELKANVSTVVGKLEECQEEHAQARETVARLEAKTEAIAKAQPPNVQAEVRAAEGVAAR